MKLAFLLLVLVNVVLFAWQHGVFGHYGDGGREPERVARQVEPERIRVLTEKDVQALRERAKQSSGVVDLGLAQACLEFGDFSAAEAARAEKALAALSTTIKVTVGLVEAPGWYMVYLPPFKTLGEAERRAEELRKLGIKDMLVMNENSAMRFAISLGSFRDPNAAKAHLAALDKAGIKGARIADRPSAVTLTRFQLRDVDAAAAQQLVALRGDFPAQTVRACPAS
ncbi:MAG: SPOR domain-containing protein [Burkholderiaceae bacterium]